MGKMVFRAYFLKIIQKASAARQKSKEECTLLGEIRRYAEIVRFSDLVAYMTKRRMPNVKIQPSDRYIRSYQYYGDPEILYLVNEGTEVYEGSVYLPGRRESCYRYEAWENHLEAVKSRCTEKGLEISVRIEPGKSWILVFDEAGFMECKKVSLVSEERIRKLDTGWKRSVCESVAYPAFGEAAEVVLPDAAELEMPEFAGVLHYDECND